MRTAVLASLLVLGVVGPHVGAAQVYRTESLPPAVTAAGAGWQLNGEAIFYAGAFYYPSGPDRFFDGKVMVRSGVYDGVPLYEDATLQPYSVVFVPIGGAVMRPYTRARSIDNWRLTPRAAQFGDVRPDSLRADSRDTLAQSGDVHASDAYVLVPLSRVRRDASSQASATEPPFDARGVVSLAALAAASPARTTTGPAAPASSTEGVWIEWQDGRWFNSGPAVDYDANRFEPVGDYRGFPVYRERGGAGTRIFVTTVHDGPLAPFERR